MRVWSKRGAVAVAAGVLSVAMAAAASAATADAWDFSEVAPGDAVPASQAFGSVPLYAASNTTLWAVAHDGGSALDVDAWRYLAPGQQVDMTSTMLSTDAGFESDRYGGSDHGSDAFDPGTGDFSVSLWLEPTSASLFPRGSIQPSKISPNVVQKGRANAAGGYWKLYLQMSKRGAAYVWQPICVLKGADKTIAKVNNGHKGFALTDGLGYTITCARVAGVLSVTATQDGGASHTASAPSGQQVANTEAVSVAHKPRSTDPTDMYDGLLDSLTISVG